MRTITLDQPDTSPRPLVVLRHAVAAEWLRLWTVRSTWWGILAALAIAVGMGLTFAFDFEGERIPIWVAGEFTILIAQLPLLVVAMLAVTSDHATGAIRSSLQWTPRRGMLLTARTAVAVTVVTVAGVLVAATADLTAWLWLRTELLLADVVASLVDVAAVIAIGAVVTLALATILRTAAGTLTIAFLLLFAFPAMLPEFGIAWLDVLGRYTPGMSLTLLEGLGADDVPHLTGVLLGWVVVPLAVSGWLFSRRDAA